MTDIGFVLAKIHGIHSKSANGDTLAKYQKIDSIDKLERALFAAESTDTPTKKLYTKVEERYRAKMMSQITDITRYLGSDNKLINAFLIKTECENVKRIVRAFFYGADLSGLTALHIPDGLDYRLIAKTDFSKPSSLQNVLGGTMYDFIVGLSDSAKNVTKMDNELDKFCYQNLMKAAKTLSGEQRQKMVSLLIEECDLLNMIWALRLKHNYKADDETIKSMLITDDNLISADKIIELAGSSDILSAKAMTKYKHLLPSAQDGAGFDIIAAEKTFREYINRKYGRMFAHEYNILSVVAYIALKNKEYADIVQIVESLRYKA